MDQFTTRHMNKEDTAHVFLYEELQKATNDFSPTHFIGEGGFGRVYYAELSNGRIAAAKQLERAGRQGEKEFQVEVRACSLSFLPRCLHTFENESFGLQLPSRFAISWMVAFSSLEKFSEEGSGWARQHPAVCIAEQNFLCTKVSLCTNHELSPYVIAPLERQRLWVAGIDPRRSSTSLTSPQQIHHFLRSTVWGVWMPVSTDLCRLGGARATSIWLSGQRGFKRKMLKKHLLASHWFVKAQSPHSPLD
jgi:hypothetical protein